VDWIHLAQDSSNGGLFWTRQWTLVFNKGRIYWPGEWLSESQKWPSSMELLKLDRDL